MEQTTVVLNKVTDELINFLTGQDIQYLRDMHPRCAEDIAARAQKQWDAILKLAKA